MPKKSRPPRFKNINQLGETLVRAMLDDWIEEESQKADVVPSDSKATSKKKVTKKKGA